MTLGRGWIAISALLIGTGVARAQGGFGPGRGGLFGGGMGHVVTGEPFSDTSTSGSVDTLANGTTITHTSTGTEARDSQGRTLTTITTTTGTGTSVTRTTLFDPVAHTITTWSSTSTVADQIQLPTNPPGGRGQGKGGPGPGGPWAGGPGGRSGIRPQVTRTVLSPTTIAGDSATGVKITTTVPAGAEGNNNPLVSTREVWTSTDLGIVLQETSDSPREGTHTFEVTSLTKGEPNASLFQVPSNYTVKAESRHRPGA